MGQEQSRGATTFEEDVRSAKKGMKKYSSAIDEMVTKNSNYTYISVEKGGKQEKSIGHDAEKSAEAEDHDAQKEDGGIYTVNTQTSNDDINIDKFKVESNKLLDNLMNYPPYLPILTEQAINTISTSGLDPRLFDKIEENGILDVLAINQTQSMKKCKKIAHRQHIICSKMKKLDGQPLLKKIQLFNHNTQQQVKHAHEISQLHATIVEMDESITRIFETLHDIQSHLPKDIRQEISNPLIHLQNNP